MAKRQMVEVRLYECGIFEVNDINNNYKTRKYRGCKDKDGMIYDSYFCLKSSWRKYLIKLIDESIKNIDEDISSSISKRCKMVALKISI